MTSLRHVLCLRNGYIKGSKTDHLKYMEIILKTSFVRFVALFELKWIVFSSISCTTLLTAPLSDPSSLPGRFKYIHSHWKVWFILCLRIIQWNIIYAKLALSLSNSTFTHNQATATRPYIQFCGWCQQVRLLVRIRLIAFILFYI